jgi:hypothetical protein
VNRGYVRTFGNERASRDASAASGATGHTSRTTGLSRIFESVPAWPGGYR